MLGPEKRGQWRQMVLERSTCGAESTLSDPAGREQHVRDVWNVWPVASLALCSPCPAYLAGPLPEV